MEALRSPLPETAGAQAMSRQDDGLQDGKREHRISMPNLQLGALEALLPVLNCITQ
jgi:hypothetical protein